MPDLDIENLFRYQSDVKDGWISGPFKSLYKFATGDNSANIKTPNVFSFSLFATKKVADGFKKKDKSIIEGWMDGYCNKQLEKFEIFLNNDMWSDYCIIHFLDDAMGDLIYKGVSIVDYITERMSQHRGRYVCIIYSCNSAVSCSSEYFGTVVRFTPLIMPDIDVVIFRDAHTTMPNPKTDYDVRWKNTWMNKTDKKFWMYNMVDYNPDHNLGRPTMFAATWGARKIGREKVIFNKRMWDLFENGLIAVKSEKYGIDEKLLLYFVNRPNFLKDTYIVGITHTINILLPKVNKRQFQRLVVKGQTLDFFEEVKPKSMKQTWNVDIEDPEDLSDVENITSYYSDIVCLLYDMDRVMYETNGVHPNLNDLYYNIELIKTNTDNDYNSRLLKEVYDPVPSRWHLWNFVFDYEDMKKFTLESYYKNYGQDAEIMLDTVNYCGLTKKYFTGGEFNYDKYMFIRSDRNHKKLPRDIVFPDGYNSPKP